MGSQTDHKSNPSGRWMMETSKRINDGWKVTDNGHFDRWFLKESRQNCLFFAIMDHFMDLVCVFPAFQIMTYQLFEKFLVHFHRILYLVTLWAKCFRLLKKMESVPAVGEMINLSIWMTYPSLTNTCWETKNLIFSPRSLRGYYFFRYVNATLEGKKLWAKNLKKLTKRDRYGETLVQHDRI